MLDPQLLRKDTETVSRALSRRGFVLDVERVQSLERRRKQSQTATERLQAQKNSHAKG